MAKTKKRKKYRRKGKTTKGRSLSRFLLLGACLILTAVSIFFVFHLRNEGISLKGLWEGLTKKTGLPKKREASIYFADPQGDYLMKEVREIDIKGTLTDQARDLIEALISGPRKGGVPTLPPRTALRGLSIDQHGTARVDFSVELIRGHPGGSSAEIMTIYSVVNSLVLNFPQIQRVKILIQGKERETLVGHISINEPLEADLKLIRSSPQQN
jgi:hypothetical protein